MVSDTWPEPHLHPGNDTDSSVNLIKSDFKSLRFFFLRVKLGRSSSDQLWKYELWSKWKKLRLMQMMPPPPEESIATGADVINPRDCI